MERRLKSGVCAAAALALVLCFGMVAGRLEIMPMLLLFFPSVWAGK